MKKRRADFTNSSLPLNYVGIIYATSQTSASGRENEKCADCEIVDVALAISAVLSRHGIKSDMVNLDPNCLVDLRKYDYILNLAETIYGFPLADYEVAARLEELKIPFSGASSISLRACSDKAFTKTELGKLGIATPAFELIQPGDPILSHLNFPVIVKPVHEDSSQGISRDSVVWNEKDLARQILNTHQLYLQGALVEEFIEGRDISASILGNGAEAVCLPLSEILYIPENEVKFLTFETKWLEQSLGYSTSKILCPCQIDPKIDAKIHRIALQANQVMKCRDYSRIDFRLRGEEIFLLEVNPNPDLNPQESGYIQSGNAQGFNYDDLIFQILVISYKNRFSARNPILLRKSYENYINRINSRRPASAATPAISNP
jgi:D-alanine-D-alanine ligase